MERHAVELRADLERERFDRGQEQERAERLVGEVADTVELCIDCDAWCQLAIPST